MARITCNYTGLLLLLCAVPSAMALPTPVYGVPINFTGLANVAFSSTSFDNIVCPATLSGCGGSFQATVTQYGTTHTINNVNLWCVDYQLDVTTTSNYTANIMALPGLNATVAERAAFDARNSVRYGDVSSQNTATTPHWVTNLGAGYNDALSRYQLAATLIMAYENKIPNPPPPNPGGPDYSKPYDNVKNNGASSDVLTNRNRAIQAAIWTIMENTDVSPVPSLTSANISAGVSGFTNWIEWAKANVSDAGVNGWGVVSGGYTNSHGVWSLDYGSGAIQTFLVELPEPSFYGVIVLGFGGLLAVAARKKRRQRQA